MALSQTNSVRPADPRLAWDTVLDLGTDDAPLVARLERAVRDAVHAGRVPAGAALPPSRALAETLGVSRWVVTEVYGQLVAEGFCEARIGSGTRIAAGAAAHAAPKRATSTSPGPAGRARLDLAPGVPDLRHVPRAAWLRALRDALADAPDADLGAPDPAGHLAARAAVVEYLARARSTCASPDDLLVTHGATDGMARLSRALRSAGHRALLVEDPSWARLRDVARDAGLVPVPVPVDARGVDVDALVAAAARTGARAALVAPAHQFPTGVALAPERRDALVSWARASDGLVIEDDYDAEFRYDRRPVAALQGHDPGRVALLGSLSKTVSPAFGLGWLVLPPRWRERLGPQAGGPAPSTLDQLALARFLTDGGYERHLRAARGRFRRRRAGLLDALAATLPGLPVTGLAAGLHVVLGLPDGVAAAAVVRAAAARDVAVADLRRYRVAAAPLPGTPDEALVVGYGNLADARVGEAVAGLAATLRSVGI
ncbi:MocR-like pyridoxine biosynthesis transcription factor PdxR [Krasilnikoviella flava]|uniref:GntR family transcriptional regulator / MocR family aminotransferase n=1 Tax=Krasilnikoviella flava TaxID=526729 RepID=A0A1T5ILF2_9MICO|nr:PLP-dependent aminotransferase family protein [Krasilnikoviella flava]SKC40034.1 GntR family transcriptional regulator / MocR family aminotransferase [Krasilnikoviella flava]